ncbi:MAG: type II secretion system F family protein [Planctomycetales bacterium]|nr:type II secretion system F family protein [Planctomycetales bacterium]
MNMMLIVSAAIFVGFAAMAWMVMDMMAGRKSRAEERLTEFRDPNRRRTEKKETIGQKLEKVSPNLARPMQPKSEKEVGKLKQRLSFAGFRSEAAPGIFLASKFIGLIVGLACTGGAAIIAGFKLHLILVLAFFLFLPDIVIWFLGRRRKEAIFLGLPDALDLMVVCVEAGLGLDQALRRVADEMKKSHRTIAEEFAISNFQIQYGKTRRDVLQELGSRTGVDDLRSLAAVLIQAEKFGASVGQALRVQSNSMRTRRRQLAEERAAKTAVQLIFPLVIFIFPGIFVVLVGPAAITMMNEMFPAMGG